MKTKSDKTTKKVEEILAKVRPYIQMHGGDVSLIGVENGIVTLNISGACAHCSLADLTYNTLITGLLKDEVRGVKEVRLIK
jgi:Fe-S cluster biogenesis protein NfuA